MNSKSAPEYAVCLERGTFCLNGTQDGPACNRSQSLVLLPIGDPLWNFDYSDVFIVVGESIIAGRHPVVPRVGSILLMIYPFHLS